MHISFSVYGLAGKKAFEETLRVAISSEHFNRAEPNVYAREYLVITLKNAIKCAIISALLCINLW